MSEETQKGQQNEITRRHAILALLSGGAVLGAGALGTLFTRFASDTITSARDRVALHEYSPEIDKFNDIKEVVDYDFAYNRVKYNNGARYTEYSTNPDATTVLYKIPGSSMPGPGNYFPYNDELGIAATEFGIDARFLHLNGNSPEDLESPDGINTQGSGAQAEIIAAGIAESFGRYNKIVIDAESMGAAGLFEALPRIAEKLAEYYKNNPNAEKIEFILGLNSPAVNARDVLFNIGKLHEDPFILAAILRIDSLGIPFALSNQERAIAGIQALRSVNNAHPQGLGGMVDIHLTGSANDQTVPHKMIIDFYNALQTIPTMKTTKRITNSDAHVPHLLPEGLTGTFSPEQYHSLITDPSIRNYLKKLIPQNLAA